ncbi:D-alanyl-D-alanine carboxypeptidase (penicillin-binding protein 5/6) [Haloactinopolyspora alba]|uniref:D-alanyl-D-alanine carboxypeptidase (Penicillin-binding protein 5/6) n=1 Tax=Haloactinopolyspora alba TaxID=648780 RepID=A0A2P8E5G0_9ACTN|nr:D-alanyl-D-alanine carboxypeptidase family protein [Haloactinopolyspora alba]PSL04703.1 D-alanyl-D-alanine carboxypeptidase (penicillin-binding protein 5/6) [Haloactinopolyspora alba]
MAALAFLAAGPATVTVTTAVATAPAVPPPTVTRTPSPSGSPTVLEPPPGSPVDHTVGGETLATAGAVLAGDGTAPVPTVDARAWLVAETDSGDVLGAYSPHARRAPASTIKLLTALATAPVLEPEQHYTVTAADAEVQGSRVGLVPAQEYTVDELQHGLLLASGNDAAHAIAVAAGGVGTTLELMNEQAQRLGAFDTNALTPHGLDVPGQVTSAYDLALIGRHVLEHERLAELARTRNYDFPGRDGATFQIQNQNRLLGSYKGAVGLKTGYTSQAGHTFVGAATRDGRTLLAVVLGTGGRAENAAAALLDWGFGASTAEPVGRLVSTEDVAAMVADAEQEGEDPAGNPFDEYGDALSSPGGTSDGVPSVVWFSLAAAAAFGGAGFVVRRRNARRGSGRYAPRR